MKIISGVVKRIEKAAKGGMSTEDRNRGLMKKESEGGTFKGPLGDFLPPQAKDDIQNLTIFAEAIKRMDIGSSTNSIASDLKAKDLTQKEVISLIDDLIGCLPVLKQLLNEAKRKVKTGGL